MKNIIPYSVTGRSGVSRFFNGCILTDEDCAGVLRKFHEVKVCDADLKTAPIRPLLIYLMISIIPGCLIINTMALPSSETRETAFRLHGRTIRHVARFSSPANEATRMSSYVPALTDMRTRQGPSPSRRPCLYAYRSCRYVGLRNLPTQQRRHSISPSCLNRTRDSYLPHQSSGSLRQKRREPSFPSPRILSSAVFSWYLLLVSLH